MPEVQDIFEQHGEAYRLTHPMTLVQMKVMNSITKCRTSALGANLTLCEDCGSIEISYNSCRNRHCPKCQNLSKEKWI